MSGIRQPLQDILTKLTAIKVANLDGQTVSLHARIWNSQLDFMEDGSGYLFPRPAAFVEVVNDVQYEIMGQGFRNADISFRIHLIHDFYNNDGTYDQDLGIFDLRDQVLANSNNPDNAGLSFYVPTDCTPLICVSETQEYNHKNVYHYILNFVANFTDSKGSSFDTGAGQYDDTANPNIELETNASKGQGAAYIPDTDYFIIPKNNG